MFITEVNQKWNEERRDYDWHFTTEEEKEIIIKAEIINEIIEEYIRNHTYLGRK